VTIRFSVKLDVGFSGAVRNVAYASSNELPQVPSNETLNPVPPTAIRLVSFTVERTNDSVRIAWQTSSEVDTFGFHVLRSTSNNPENAVRVNAEVVLGQGSKGGMYEVIDENAEAGVTYYYWLQEVELDGDEITYTDWVQQVGPAQGQGTRTFSVYVPMLMR
jgi:hypothetical protein